MQRRIWIPKDALQIARTLPRAFLFVAAEHLDLHRRSPQSAQCCAPMLSASPKELPAAYLHARPAPAHSSHSRPAELGRRSGEHSTSQPMMLPAPATQAVQLRTSRQRALVRRRCDSPRGPARSSLREDGGPAPGAGCRVVGPGQRTRGRGGRWSWRTVVGREGTDCHSGSGPRGAGASWDRLNCSHEQI